MHPVSGPVLTPTDGMIITGTQHLFGRAEIEIDEYVQISEESGAQRQPIRSPTHIVVLGTPWIWDRCWKSVKYDNLRILLRAHPNAKRLFLGIGSCYPMGHESAVMADIMANIGELDVFHGATVTVRDGLALKTLTSSSGVLSIRSLPCPAYWALEGTAKEPRERAVIWYDPTIGLSRSSFRPGSEPNLRSWSRLKAHRNAFGREYARSGGRVYCVSKSEIPGALLAGLPEPSVIADIEHAKDILSSASEIFSGRVHLAVPAFRHCPKVQLVKVDSRARTLTDVKLDLIPLDGALEQYVTILKNFAL